MRKQVGTKVYDTEKSEQVTYVGGEILYCQKMSRGFFLYGEERGFTPLEESAVIEFIGEKLYNELTKRKGGKWGECCLRINGEDAERLKDYARNEGRSVKSLIEEWVDGLLEQEQEA